MRTIAAKPAIVAQPRQSLSIGLALVKLRSYPTRNHETSFAVQSSAESNTSGCKLPDVKRTRLVVSRVPADTIRKSWEVSEILADMSAIRFVAGKQIKGRAATGTIQLLCHVKPGASANREGITAMTDKVIDVCVAAQAREGEANTAVRNVIAKTLKVPKSNVEITKGMKSREKTVAIQIGPNSTPAEEMERMQALLLSSVAQ